MILLYNNEYGVVVIMGNIINFKQRTLEEGLMHMCKLLDKIYGKSALDILKEFGNPYDAPINLHTLLQQMGISAIPMNFTSLEKKINKGHILGLVLADGDNVAIYYSVGDTPNRQRFTIAHELGHICKHLKPETSDYPYIDWRIEEQADSIYEIQANAFAGELLIPLHKLKEIYLSMSFPTSKKLAAFFSVSINVMEARLHQLGVSYFNEKGQAVVYDYTE